MKFDIYEGVILCQQVILLEMLTNQYEAYHKHHGLNHQNYQQ